jgi:hypothetical protein
MHRVTRQLVEWNKTPEGRERRIRGIRTYWAARRAEKAGEREPTGLEILVPVVDCFELAAIDGDDRLIEQVQPAA